MMSSSWKHRKRFPSQACPAKMVYEAKFEFIFGGRDFRGTNSHLYIKTVGPKNLGKTPNNFHIYIYLYKYIYTYLKDTGSRSHRTNLSGNWCSITPHLVELGEMSHPHLA